MLFPAPNERALICQIQQAAAVRDVAVRDTSFERLAITWRPRIRSQALRMSRQDPAEYEQIGLVALFRACINFDTDGACSFEAYGSQAIRYAMRSELRRRRSRSATLVAFQASDELPEPIVSEPWTDQCIPSLHDWIRALPARERSIIEGVYFSRKSSAAVARDVGLSPARVSQILSSLLRSARAYIAASN